MDLIPNPNVYPPDGYYFVDAEGVRHTGTSWADLVAKVRDFRVRNGKPIGNPIAEINEFTCERYPQGCREPKKVFPGQANAPGVSPGAKMAAAVNRWFYAVIQALSTRPSPLVSAAEAQRRADICLKCPRQASFVSHCGTCADAAFRLGLSIRKAKDVANGDSLRGCGILGEDTRTSVWLDGLEPSNAEGLPTKCWRKAP